MLEVCWIQSPHIGSLCQNLSKSTSFESRKQKQKFRNPRIFQKIVLGNIVKMMCTKYQCVDKHNLWKSRQSLKVEIQKLNFGPNYTINNRKTDAHREFHKNRTMVKCSKLGEKIVEDVRRRNRARAKYRCFNFWS